MKVMKVKTTIFHLIMATITFPLIFPLGYLTRRFIEPNKKHTWKNEWYIYWEVFLKTN